MALDGFVTISFSVSLPFLSLYLHNERGITMTLVGVLFLVGGLCSGMTSMLGGMICDYIGRRNLILLASSASIFTHVILGILMLLKTSVWLIAFIYILLRCIIGVLPSAIYAVVADLTPKARLTEAYAVVRIGGNIGFALGPAIGGYLRGFLSYGYLFVIASLTFFIIIFLVYFFLKESYQQEPGVENPFSMVTIFQDKIFLFFTILNIMLLISMAHMGSTLSVFAINNLGFSTLEYGFLLTLNGIIVVLTQYPVAYGVNKLSKKTGLILGSLMYVIGYLTLGWFNTFHQLLLMITIITVGEVIFSPVSSSVVAELAPAHQRGRYMGVFSLAQTIGFSFSPLFGGILLDKFSDQPVILWGIISISGTLPLLGFLIWGSLIQRQKNTQRYN